MTDPSPDTALGAGPVANVSVVEFDVRAAPSVVYAAFLDRARWLPSFVRADLIAGEAETIGALHHITGHFEGQTLTRYERLLFVETGKRRVIASWKEELPVVCIIDFHVMERAGGAHFTFTIHAVFTDTSADEAAAFGAATLAQISEDFALLRDHIERSAD